MGKDYYDYLWDVGTEYAVRTAQDYVRSKYFTQTKTNSTTENNMSEGNVRKIASAVNRRRKRFKLSKLIRSTVNYTRQNLGTRLINSPHTWSHKHLVSEYGLNGGYMGICMDSQFNCTPMHLYDLNLYVGNTEDNGTNYPVNGTGPSADSNARAWWWNNDNYFQRLVSATTEPRWYINDPRTVSQNETPGTKVYKKAIDINFIVYGCGAMPTEYKIDVIKITDPKMCPDYDQTLTSDQLKEYGQNWANLVRMNSVNPLLRKLEPGPRPVKPWYKIIASKRIKVGEQVSDTARLPSVQGRIHVDVNEVQNMCWTYKNFALETGDTVYDNVPTVEAGDIAGNNNFMHKPYYTSRYYLMIRALSPVDCNQVASGQAGGNLDGLVGETGRGWSTFQTDGIASPTATNWQPSYDIALSTTWLTVNANS